MIRFTDLLKENPDTIYYKKKTYNYNTDARENADVLSMKFIRYKRDKGAGSKIIKIK